MKQTIRNEIIQYAKETYHTEPEYLWAKTPDCAVLRHRDNRKWYAIIMDISKEKLRMQGDEIVDILNVKCDPVMITSLLQSEGFFPAYHMNKTYWITILLDGTVSAEKITGLLDFSYDMTAKKKKQEKKEKENM